MTTDTKLRILIADDSDVIRRHLKALIGPMPFVELVGDVATADDVISLARAERPDVMLLDIAMPGGGINVLMTLKREQPETVVVILTNHAGPYYERVTRSLGADYFLDKKLAFEHVPAVLREIAKT